MTTEGPYASPFPVDRQTVETWRDRMGAGTSADAPAVFHGKDPVLTAEDELRAVTERLQAAYGTPHLGNFANPTDEFVYIILSRKTPEKAYQESFNRLKQLGTWDQVADLSEEVLEALIFGGGLEAFKAATLKAGLNAIRNRFGSTELSLAAHMEDDELFSFLLSVPGIGPKSARCIMLYAFQRLVFPVDAHVGRVLGRLGTFEPLGIYLQEVDHKRRQAMLADLVPPDLRYPLRVNLIAHGRTVCRAQVPLCEQCVVKDMCRHAWLVNKRQENQPLLP